MLSSGRFSGILGDAFEVEESHIKGNELVALICIFNLSLSFRFDFYYYKRYAHSETNL